MKRKETMPTAGVGYCVTICASHLANDSELRKIFKPGELVYYYPETIEILEDQDVVLIGVILYSDKNPEMIVVQMAKLSFSEPQFVGLLKTTPGLYSHFMKRLRRSNPSLGTKGLPYKEVHKRLKESCFSSQNAFERDAFIGIDDEDNYLDIVEVKSRRLKSLGKSPKTVSL